MSTKTKRDYGQFSKAAARLFANVAKAHGFERVTDSEWKRTVGVSLQRVIFQQTQWGGGEFCVNLAVNIISSAPYLSLEGQKSNGILIDQWRLCTIGEDGRNGSDWYPAANKEELEASMEKVASDFANAESWFSQYDSLDKVIPFNEHVAEYHGPEGRRHNEQFNLGVLHLLAGNISEARRFFTESKRLVLQERDVLAREHESDPRARKRPFEAPPWVEGRLALIDHHLATYCS